MAAVSGCEKTYDILCQVSQVPSISPEKSGREFSKRLLVKGFIGVFTSQWNPVPESIQLKI